MNDKGLVMSGFEHPKPAEIRHYDQLASWLRELIVGGHIALGDKLPGESRSHMPAFARPEGRYHRPDVGNS